MSNLLANADFCNGKDRRRSSRATYGRRGLRPSGNVVGTTYKFMSYADAVKKRGNAFVDPLSNGVQLSDSLSPGPLTDLLNVQVAMTCGYITVAAGSLRYVDMAVDLALSLKEKDDKAIALILDPELKPRVSSRSLSVFDHVATHSHPIERKYLSKLAIGHISPFDRTIFLDADMLAVHAPGEFWTRLERYRFAVQGEYLTQADHRSHYRVKTNELMKDFMVNRYLKCGSAFMYFEKNAGIRIMDDCRQLARRWIGDKRLSTKYKINRFFSHEWILGIVGGALDNAIIDEPLAFPYDIAAVTPRAFTTPFIHVGKPPGAALMAYLQTAITCRRKQFGIPLTSWPAWNWKMHKGAPRSLSDLYPFLLSIWSRVQHSLLYSYS